MLRVSTAHSRPFGAAARPARLGRPLVGLVARASSGGPQQQQEAPPQGAPATSTRKEEELPPWVRREKERELQAQQAASGGFKLPWPLALLFSTFVAIAATGSIFEYVDGNAVFGVIQPDSPLWAPILLFMAITGYPMAGLLFKYGVDGFNEAAELQDRLDGYLPPDKK